MGLPLVREYSKHEPAYRIRESGSPWTAIHLVLNAPHLQTKMYKQELIYGYVRNRSLAKTRK